MTEMTDEIRNTLYGIILSHLCAIGDSLPDIFKNNTELRDAYEAVSPKLKVEDTMSLKFTINEVSPVGKIDFIDRRREDIASKPTDHLADRVGSLGPRDGDLGKHALTSRGKHNTPRRIRNQFGLQKELKKELKECLDFLKQNLKKSKSELKELLENFPHKAKLFALVDHIIATSMGGWKVKGNKLVNETGHEASKENWALLTDGKLGTLNKTTFDIDVEPLFEIRNSLYDSR